MSLKQKTIGGLLWTFIDGIVSQGLQFIVGIILARLLSPREFGLIGMLTNLSANVDERIIEQMQASHPLKKPLTPAEVADTVIYLINTSQQVNGMNIVINAAKNIL